MRIHIRIITFLFILISRTSLFAATSETFPAKHLEQDLPFTYGKLPLSFEENRGQTDQKVAFLSRGKGYTLFLTQTKAVLSLQQSNRSKEDNNRRGAEMSFHSVNPATRQIFLEMELVGANSNATILGEAGLLGRSNYFIGNDPKRWRTDIPNYQKVKYQNIYPGVNLVYYGNQEQLEYDFVVAPGADPKQIALQMRGAERIEIDQQGRLILHSKGSTLQMHKPVIYQNVGETRREIEGRYLIKGKDNIAFQIADYDRKKPLIIDPILSYSGYLGGNRIDSGNSIAVDSSGNVYVAGETGSRDFPITDGGFQHEQPGDQNQSLDDVFVTKLNPAGTALIYSTYLGGGSEDPRSELNDNQNKANGIAIDASGNAYITGWTNSTRFPTARPLQAAWGGGGCGHLAVRFPCPDAFVTKLNPTGNALVYSTYLGGGNDDEGNGITVDASGNAYITGATRSANFPTENPIQTFGGGDCGRDYLSDVRHLCRDAFVTKINAAGTAFVYSTYLGGSGREFGRGIAADLFGNAYVTGWTDSSDFPTRSAVQNVSGGGSCSRSGEDVIPSPCPDLFITKINSVGSALVYSTYLGGSANDFGNGIAIDAFGNVYVAGSTRSLNFPTTPGAFQNIHHGGGNPGFDTEAGDAFILKMNAAGNGLIYSTYLGGSGAEVASGIALDASGNAYVTGFTNSNNFPMVNPVQSGGGGNIDAFVTKLNAAGKALIYSTYLGGSGRDEGTSIAVDPLGNAYMTGRTDSTDFPTTPAVFQRTNHGSGDAFIAKIGVTQSSSDAFNRDNATTLGGNWNEILGDLEIFNNQVRNTTTNNKAAIFTRALGPDQAVSVDCKVTQPGNACGVMARWSSENNFYRARLDVGTQDIILFKTVNGITTKLGQFTRPLSFDTFYRLRLVVRGSKVAVYFANESTPGIFVTDTSLPTGSFAGIRSYAASAHATLFENFDVTTPLIDTFNRANSTNLGAAWSEYLSDLEIFDGVVRNGNGGGQPKAARYVVSVGPDQDVAADCKLTAAGNSCGVMARWSSASNFYHVRLDVGTQDIVLFKTVNGITTKLGQFGRPLKFNTYYRLRLIVKGSTLSVFFGNEGTAALSLSDTALTSGGYAGIRSYATVANTASFNDFNVTVAP